MQVEGQMNAKKATAFLLWQFLLLQTHAFVHPLFHTTFASANSSESNRSHGNRRNLLFSAAEEIAPVIVETAPLSKSQTIADGDDFVKPPLDKRSYRAIKLQNNLQVLLVSDPETDVEAGAVVRSSSISCPFSVFQNLFCSPN